MYERFATSCQAALHTQDDVSATLPSKFINHRLTTADSISVSLTPPPLPLLLVTVPHTFFRSSLSSSHTPCLLVHHARTSFALEGSEPPPRTTRQRGDRVSAVPDDTPIVLRDERELYVSKQD